MKKTFTTVIIGLLSAFAINTGTAQTNLNLDSWAGATPAPTNWSALLNPYKSFVGDTSVVQGGGQAGFAAKLKPVDLTVLGLGIGASILQYGPTGKGDVYTNRPDSVEFYYMNTSSAVATEIDIYLTSYNSTSGLIDTIAKSVLTYTDVVSSFTLVKEKLQYDIVNGNLTPDSLKINITAASDVATAQMHTEFFTIDEIQFKGTAPIVTSLTTYASGTNTKVYPTVADKEIIFDFENSGNRNIRIYDITGKEIDRVNTNNKRHSLQVSIFDNGYYIYKICDENDRELKTGKFVISRK